MKKFIIKHKVGLITAFFVGLICVLPQIVFISKLGDNYRGIHMFATPNEDGYIAIAQEILDGHPKVASMPFYEYKDKTPLLPSTLLKIYTTPVQLFNISLVNAVIAGKFIFPALLSFFIYLFLYTLFKTEDNKNNKISIFFAVTASFFVIFGFDLVDYNSVISFLKGNSSPQGFLIWSRPVNPISGAILLFFFLYSLQRFNYKKKKRWIFWASVSLALMMSSYVFSWTLAVVVLGFYGLMFLLEKRRDMLFSYIAILILGILFSIKYWINSIKASQMDWYSEASARIGLFHTHAPHLNKLVIATIILFCLVSVFAYYKKIIRKDLLPEWWRMSAILLLSSFIVYNQQIITGTEIWYYHYVFYTIPFCFVVVIICLRNIFYKFYPKQTLLILGLIFFSSLSLGVFYQVSAYNNNFDYFENLQKKQVFFDFFNDAEKDCAVLSLDTYGERMSVLIPAFTHCNSYYSGENQSVLADPEDFYHRYLVLLRAKGVKTEGIVKYISDNKSEVEHALQYQLQRTLGFEDKKMEEKLLSLPDDYQEFMKGNFYDQLKRFRIDYILTKDGLEDSVLRDLPVLEEVNFDDGSVVYKL
jgi:hypothetical protein